ncbi:MAG: hypothetical protein QNJ47_20430 [Nostocaceae cyanobacterium]|nr:hypothetical protein [Nostocaceae cyanobacterium]
MKRILIMAAFLLLFAGKAVATTVIYQSMDDLSQNADGIIVGTVKEVKSAKVEDDINTYVTLRGIKVLKGIYDRNEISLAMEGGFVEQEGLEIEGSPEFKKGERVIVFVENNGSTIVPFVGFDQGVFKVVKGKQNREIVTDSLGNRIFRIQKGGHLMKEKRFSGKTRVVGGPDSIGINRQKRELQVEPGQTDDSSPTPPVSSSKISTDEISETTEEITLNLFLEDVETRIRGDVNKPLNSVSFGQPIKRVTKDQVMRGEKPGSNNVDTQPVEPKPIPRRPLPPDIR